MSIYRILDRASGTFLGWYPCRSKARAARTTGGATKVVAHLVRARDVSTSAEILRAVETYALSAGMTECYRLWAVPTPAEQAAVWALAGGRERALRWPHVGATH